MFQVQCLNTHPVIAWLGIALQAASLISPCLLWWPPAESHYDIYDLPVVGYVSHAHCIALSYSVGNKITITTTWRSKAISRRNVDRRIDNVFLNNVCLQHGAILTMELAIERIHKEYGGRGGVIVCTSSTAGGVWSTSVYPVNAHVICCNGL